MSLKLVDLKGQDVDIISRDLDERNKVVEILEAAGMRYAGTSQNGLLNVGWSSSWDNEFVIISSEDCTNYILAANFLAANQPEPTSDKHLKFLDDLIANWKEEQRARDPESSMYGLIDIHLTLISSIRTHYLAHKKLADND